MFVPAMAPFHELDSLPAVHSRVQYFQWLSAASTQSNHISFANPGHWVQTGQAPLLDAYGCSQERQ